MFLPDVDVADDESLMHYMPARHFRTLMCVSSLHATRLDKQEKDPADGVLPMITRPAPQDALMLRAITPCMDDAAIASFTRSQSAAINSGRRRTYIHSWMMCAIENAEMWREFADNGNGVCIKTTGSRLKVALGIGAFPGRTTNPAGFPVTIQVKKCIYGSSDSSLPVVNAYFSTTKKNSNFHQQREARVEASLSGDRARINYEMSDPPESQKLPVQFDRLFEAVFMGPNMDDPTRKELSQSADQLAGSKVARHSTIQF